MPPVANTVEYTILFQLRFFLKSGRRSRRQLSLDFGALMAELVTLLPRGILEEDMTVAMNDSIINVSIVVRALHLSAAIIATITRTFVQDLSSRTGIVLTLYETARIVSKRTVAYPCPPPSALAAPPVAPPVPPPSFPLPFTPIATESESQTTKEDPTSDLHVHALVSSLVVVVALAVILLGVLLCVIRRLRRVEERTRHVTTHRGDDMHRMMRNLLALKRQSTRAVIGPDTLQTHGTPLEAISPVIAWLQQQEVNIEEREHMDEPDTMTVDAMEIEIQSIS